MERSTRVHVAGHRGLAGGAVLRELQRRGYSNLLRRTHTELDLEDARADTPRSVGLDGESSCERDCTEGCFPGERRCGNLPCLSARRNQSDRGSNKALVAQIVT